MDARVGSKLRHLDLANRKLELESIFDSIINKIPDLCLPAAYRWAGEEDFFNQTKSLKLVPFRKQHNFETSISPELSELAPGRGIQSGLNKSTSMLKVIKSPSPHSEICQPSASSKKANGIERSFFRKSKMKGTTNLGCEQSNVRIRCESRDKLMRKYSRMRIKKTKSPVDEDESSGYDRLFRKSFDEDYPFANPIADCMLTDDNIDNLRELIVSSLNIEWKMLTPIKPSSEYEEKYFDKLIYLHRNRHKCRQESGYYAIKLQTPFRHTRHSFMLDYTLPKIAGHSSGRSSAADERSKRNAKRAIKLTIPELTLTSDDQSSELPVKLREASSVVGAVNEEETDDDDDDVGSGDCSSGSGSSSGGDVSELSRDCRDFNYEHYSRFSRRNIEQSARLMKEVSRQKQQRFDDEASTSQDEMDSMRDDEELGDQVEMIINQLVNTDLSL